MQPSTKKPFNNHSKPNHFRPKPNHFAKTNGNNKSLLQKLISSQSSAPHINQGGKIVLTKLNDYNEDKCLYGPDCAHLRAQAKCQFLHERRDFVALNIPLPQKFLEDQEPQKKSKQQRKQDKIKERAERQKRLKEKFERNQRPQEDNQNQIQEQDHNNQQKPKTKPEQPTKMTEQKVMDQKQVLVQQIIKPAQQQPLTLPYIYQQLNLITSAYSSQQNQYSTKFDLKQLSMPIGEIRKRLMMKFKKNKDIEPIAKAFLQKENGFVKKIIKNIKGAYSEAFQLVQENEDQWKNIDLRQNLSEEVFPLQDIIRVLNSKKQNQEIITYYERLFSPEFGYPILFEIPQTEQQGISLNNGNLLPLTNYQILPIISPQFNFSRKFLSLNTTFTKLRSLTQFSSLMIPHLLQQKSPVQKPLAIDLMNVTYSKFVEQLMQQHLNEYQQKLKGPNKQFEFGKIQENLKKFRAFLAKYKTKLNKDYSFVLIVYNIRKFVEKIQEVSLQEYLAYDKIKQDRSFEQQKTYEKVFLLREFINIMTDNDPSKVKIIYVTPEKKFKSKNFKAILSQIDKGLKVQDQQNTAEKIQQE